MRGNGGIWVAEQVLRGDLPKAFRSRGCAWRYTECWGLGRWKHEEIGLKGRLSILNG